MASDELLDLYADATFARRMAAGLVGEGAVEDVWQDAWCALLEQPPRPGWDVRGHLWTIVRRLALRRRRSESRRRTREQALARAESLPSGAELVERMEVHRGVVEALLALDEPHRRTLLLIYFDGLEPAEIARRDGLPLETVRTHKKRALVRLRERLRREHGDDPEWFRGVLGLAGLRAEELAPAGLGPAPLPAIAAAGALTLACGLVWFTWRAERSTTSPVSTGNAASADVAAEFRREPPRETSPGREDRPKPREDRPRAREEAPARATRLTLTGRVTDPDGTAIPGAEVGAWISGLSSVEPRTSARTDASGRFSLSLLSLSALEVRARLLVLEAWAPGFQCFQQETPLATLALEPERALVLRAGRTLAGRVLDVQGRPIARASVLARGARGEAAARKLCMTDADGVFRLGLAHELEECSLEAWRGDVGWGELVVPPAGVPEALERVGELVLEERAVLRGRVLYPDGAPVRALGLAAFLVAPDGRGGFAPASGPGGGLSQSVGNTDEEGRFALAGLCAGSFSVGPAWSHRREDAGRGGREAVVAEPGKTEAQLTLAFPRVLVEAVDAEGRALEDVWVVCTPLAPEAGGAWRPAGPGLRALTLGTSARASFTGAPVARIALTVLLPGWALEQELVAAAPSWESVLRVELAPQATRGELRLVTVDGQPLAGLDVRLRTSTARIPLEGSWRSAADGLVRDLPAGRFLVELHDVELHDPRGSDDAWRFLPARTLEIPAGDLLEVRVQEENGGRLALSFAPSAQEAPATPARVATAASRPNLQTWASWQSPRTQAFLWREGNAEDEPMFLELAGARPGARWTSAGALHPGRYRLEANFPGYEPVHRWVVVAPGSTLELAVPLVVRGDSR